MKTKRKIRWFKIITNVICGALLILLAYIFISSARGAEMPGVFGFSYAAVLSGSMEETIKIDDLIIVKKQAFDKYQVGDIVTRSEKGVLVTHRIVEIDGGTVTTKGDNNNAPDRPFPERQLRGKVISVIPGGGKVIKILKSPAGLVCVILLFTAAFESGRIIDYIKRRRKKDSADTDPAES